MQLVIDIPYSVYEGICSPNTFSSDFNLAKAIERGEILPADHGRLIDMDAILKHYISSRCEVCGKDAKYWNLRESEMKNDDVAISRQLRSMGELPKLQPHPPACEKRGLIK